MRDSVVKEPVCKGLKTMACGHGRRARAHALGTSIRGPGNPITLGVPPAVLRVAPQLVSCAIHVGSAWRQRQPAAGSQTVWIQTLSPAPGEWEARPSLSSASSSREAAAGVRCKRHVGRCPWCSSRGTSVT